MHEKPRPRALVIDDDRLIRVSICRALETIGYQAHGVAAISDAMASLDRPFALAVVDVHLGDGNGFDFVRVLNAVSPRTRVVIISAHAAPTERVSASVSWLRKPFELDELLTLARPTPDEIS